MQNLELKAKYQDVEQAHILAAAIGAVRQWSKKQIDSYYMVPTGKLKLRQTADKAAELIAYQRPVDPGTKLSNYHIYSTTNDVDLERVLSFVLPLELAIIKERTLYLWENVRIHVDVVERLGCFVEFEAVLNDNEETNLSRKKVDFLTAHFQIHPNQLIKVGYYELLKESYGKSTGAA